MCIRDRYAGEGLSEEEYIRIAIDKLGLDSLEIFDPTKRIIELALLEDGL